MKLINGINNFMTKIKKTLLLLGFVSVCITKLNAQNSYHGDDKFLHFGFSLGLNTMDFGVGSTTPANISKLIPGFSVGIVSDMLLSKYLNLRFTPAMHIGDRELVFKNMPPADVVSSVLVSAPVHIKYSSERYGNIRPYLIGGGGVYVDLGRDSDKSIMLRPFDTFFEFGVGCDIYFDFFKLAPELKLALGMNNMLTPLTDRDTGNLTDAEKQYTMALNKLTSRLITLTFNFE